MTTRFIWVLLLFSFGLTACTPGENTPIKVGILHSLTGTMAISEKSVVDATLMAIDEINNSGGLLGRQIEAIFVGGKSDWASLANSIEKLIHHDQVAVIFGCWTSVCRKMVKPIVEAHDHLLFYPAQYEGLEESQNIVYTGASPNQQLTPTVKWSVENLGRRVFLVGSDYVFPHAANTIMKKQIYALGAEVVGEYYLPLGSKNMNEIIQAVSTSGADMILSTVVGDSNQAFFRELARLETRIPVMSFSIAEDELQQLDISNTVGHYAAWSYFQSLSSSENQQFVADFKHKYGSERTTNATLEAGYLGVHLWSKAVVEAGTVDPSAVRGTIKGQIYNSPEGRVTVSASNNHLWKPLYIGQVQENAQFKIIWSETEPIQPRPFPQYRSKLSWLRYLNELYHGWGKSWVAPGSGDSQV